MKKLKILHIIDDFGRGGAETLLVDILPDLNQRYELILVTLSARSDFSTDLLVCSKRFDLKYTGYSSLLAAVFRLKKIVEMEQPDLVRSQLFWSTIVARLACPKSIPLIFSVHATMNEDPISWHKRAFLNFFEKVTYRKEQCMVGVTDAVIDSFKKLHPKCGKTYLLRNFVRDEFFEQEYDFSYEKGRAMNVVCVGNLRLIKNISFLINCVRALPANIINLDIYGEGPLRKQFEREIEEQNLANIRLMGRREDICNVLPKYDLFVSSSTVEGFGIAVAEAMSIGLPVVISDIPVYREIGREQANYIDLTNPESLIIFLHNFISKPEIFRLQSEVNKVYARKVFKREDYITRLDKIYIENFR